MKEVSEALADAIKPLTKAFVIVDALDECSIADKTSLTLRRELYKYRSTIDILVTSREEKSANAYAKDFSELKISAIDEDIEKPALGDDIITTIREKAKGMYVALPTYF